MLDYTQYFLNLTEANIVGRAEWRVAYNFTRLYGMPDFNSLALHNIASAMLTHPYVFQKYYTVNHMLRDRLAFCGSLCRQVHYCAATQIQYADYDDCIANALLAGSQASITSRKPFVPFLLSMLLLVPSLFCWDCYARKSEWWCAVAFIPFHERPPIVLALKNWSLIGNKLFKTFFFFLRKLKTQF